MLLASKASTRKASARDPAPVMKAGRLEPPQLPEPQIVASHDEMDGIDSGRAKDLEREARMSLLKQTSHVPVDD